MTSGSRTNSTAILALLSALAGFVCFPGVGGLLAIALGLSARGEIDRSEGRLSGRGLAGVGIALGVLNLACLVVALGVGIAFLARDEPKVPTTLPLPATPAPPTAPVAPAPEQASPESASRDRGARETTLGSVPLVDLRADAGPLRSALDEQRRHALAEDRTLLLFVVAEDCRPCNGVALALRDRRLQQALGKSRLVRLHVEDFSAELASLDVPTETVPGFALLAETHRPLDYLHGGEWDADIPENIAPVLGGFVRGSYAKRRHPWAGLVRPDQIGL